MPAPRVSAVAPTDPSALTDPSTPTDPAARRARRRAAFLDAADEAIRAQGPGATMADVAAAAGVTKPVLYRFISDKDDLATALAERYAARLHDLVEEGTAGGGGPRGMLQRTIGAYLSFIESEPEIYEFLLQRAPAESPDAAAQLSRFTHQLASHISEVVRGELDHFGRRTDGAEAFAHGMIGMVQAAGDWWLASRSTGSTLTREELTGHLVAVLWTGLSGLPPGDVPHAGGGPQPVGGPQAADGTQPGVRRSDAQPPSR